MSTENDNKKDDNSPISNNYSKQELLKIANVLANDIFNNTNNLKYKGNLELTLQDRLIKICNHNYKPKKIED